MKLLKIAVWIGLLLLSVPLYSQEMLKFDQKGEFKIAQFTDTHIDYEDGDSKHIYRLIEKVIDAENPDLIVFTGDIVTMDDPYKPYDIISKICVEKNTPWVAVLGNHDDESNTSRLKIAELLDSYPNCLNKVSKNIAGTTNFIYPVNDENNKAQALLYFLDSNAYSIVKPKVDGYGWFETSQIVWYKEQSAAFTKANGGKPLPALAFFHIPLPEYNTVWDDADIKTIGVKNEAVCCPKINSGMFAAMVECGDVMGTFVGHDHVNDYIGCLYDIALAYGRASGGENAYGDLVQGSRIIVLKKGKRSFDTWICELDGNVVMKCNFPDSFPVKKKEKK